MEQYTKLDIIKEFIIEGIKCSLGFHDWGFCWEVPEKKEQGYVDHCGLVRESFETCQRCFIYRWDVIG